MIRAPRTGEATTVNYGWIKPTVDGSPDAWGDMINADLDGIDATIWTVSGVAHAAYPASNPAGYQTAAQVAAAIPAPYVLPTASTTVLGGVKVDGSTVTIAGGVISAVSSGGGGGISDAPNDGTGYQRKSLGWAHITHSDITDWTATLAPYALTTSIPGASSTLPVMDGTAAVGTGTTWAKADHVHPSDTSRYAATNPSGYQTAAQVSASISAAAYTLPTASTTVLGGVKVDGSTITIASGVISSAGGGGPSPSGAAPVMDGTAAAGSLTTYSRGDHVHPSDTSRYAATNPSGYQTAAQVTAALPVVTTTTPAMNGTAAIGSSGKWADGAHVHPTDTSRAPVAGVTNGSAASAGQVGEILTATASAVAAGATTVAKTAVTLNLTAGDWDIWGVGITALGAGGATTLVTSLSTTNNALDATWRNQLNRAESRGVEQSVSAGPVRAAFGQRGDADLSGHYDHLRFGLMHDWRDHLRSTEKING